MVKTATHAAAVAIYREHGPLTDPAPHGAELAELLAGVEAICRVVQGLLIHDAGLGQYGLTASDFASFSRRTLPVAERLIAILAADPSWLGQPRRPEKRSIGTCRDFALLTCALLREQGIPARVRCGFARYLAPGRFEDHWVCEYRRENERRWAIADAQLDPIHKAALSIELDAHDLPRGQFLNSRQAWRRLRDGDDPALFGQAPDTGLWFMRVNLARDFLALMKREVSDWDRWREVPDLLRGADVQDRAWGDRLAAMIGRAERDGPSDELIAAAESADLVPFWLMPDSRGS